MHFAIFLTRLKVENAWQESNKHALRKSRASKENPHSILIFKKME